MHASGHVVAATGVDLPAGVDLVADVVDVAVVGLDRHGVVSSWNAGATALTGYCAGDARGQHFSAIFAPEDYASGLPARLLHAAEADGHVSYAAWQMRHDGSRFRADTVLTALRNAGGDLLGYSVIGRDVSEQYRREGLLRDSESRSRLLVSQVVDYAIIGLDAYGLVTSWNAGAAGLKGYAAHEAIGQHFSIFYTAGDKADGLPLRLLAAAERDGRTEHTGWRVRKDGSRFWGDIVITALRDDDGALVGYAKVTRDLTDQHRLEQSVRESEARFRLLVSQVVDYAIIALDRYGVIESWNAGAERLKGYRADEAIGQHLSMFYTAGDKADGLPLRLLGAAERDGRVEHAGWRVRKDGTRFWGDVIITALRDGDGALTGFAKVTRDLSEQHRLESARATLFAAVSHDLRAPVFAIESYALLLGTADADQRRRYAEQISSSAQRVAAMVDGLFDYAKVRAAAVPISLQPLAAAELARAAIATVAARSGDGRIEVADSDLTVLGDRVAMQRVLENLLGNAVKYSPDGGRIEVGVTRYADRVRLTVCDHGRGIDADDVPTIFDEFVRGRLAEEDGGTGLGLASVKHLMSLQGGRVWIDSELDVGTTVTLELAAATEVTG